MAHIASLSQLQKPQWAVVNGELTAYDDVRIHISAEALTRALSVFEGVKGYWDDRGEVFSVRTPRRHYDRLCRSASLLHIPIHFSYDEFLHSMRLLADELLLPDRDLWFRPTLYVTEGHWGEGTAADLVVTAFTQQQAHEPMRLGVSTWRRAPDVALPTRVKCSANYVGGRLARIEVRRHGYDDAIMLNDAGRVAEVTGACLLIADGRGGVTTPSSTEGCLDSITVDVIEAAAADLGVPFARRPVERSELLAAAECGVAGTISELTLVTEVDGRAYPTDGVLSRLRARYLAAMRTSAPLDDVEMLPLVKAPATSTV